MILIIIGAIAIFGSFLGNFNVVAFVVGVILIAVGFKLQRDSEKIIDKSTRGIERVKTDLSPVGGARRELTALLKKEINESGGLWTVYYDAKNAPDRIQITNRDGVRRNFILGDYGFSDLGSAAGDIFYRIADDMGGEVTMDREMINDTPGSGGGYIWTGDGIAVEGGHRTDRYELRSITVRSNEQIQEQKKALENQRKRYKAQESNKKRLY